LEKKKIVQELRKCQIDNDGQWVAAIPEKYFLRVRQGKENCGLLEW